MRELCEITSSKRIYAADYKPAGVPFYRGKEISEKFKGNLDVSTEFFIDRDKFERIRHRFGAPVGGDLLLTSVGTLGSPYVVNHGEEFYFKDGNLTWFRKFNHLESRFLYYWLQSSQGKAELKKCTIGSSQSAYTIVLLKEMEITLPPLPIQRKIAAILSAYDDLIENNLRRIKILEEMAQNLYREWFVKFRFPGHEHARFVDSPLGRIPEGWEVKALGKIAIQTRDAVQPGSVDPETPYFGLEHLPRKSIALSDWGFAAEVKSTKLLFKKGDILFGKIRPYFHKVGVAPFSGVCSSDTIVIRPRENDWFGLVLGCTSSVEFVEHATGTSQGTKMPRANWDVLVKYQISLPNRAILCQFNNVMSDIVSQLHNFVFRNHTLRRTRDMLLPKLFSGEMDVSDLDITIPEEAVA